MSIERWDHGTNFILALEDLKHRFEDDWPRLRCRLRRFEIRFSPAFESWLVDHPTWRRCISTYDPEFRPALSHRRLAGWSLCDCVHLVPSTVCQGLARFVAVIDGGRVIPVATLVGGAGA